MEEGWNWTFGKQVRRLILTHNNIFMSDSSGVDSGIKLRPREDELHELGPEFQSRWKDYFANKPDKPIVWMGGGSKYVFNHSHKVANNRHVY